MPLDLHGIAEEATVRIESERPLSHSEFFDFCQSNSPWRIERTADGEIVIMPPASMESGYQSGEIFIQLGTWAKTDRRGTACDSSTGFELPNGAMRSPDAAWVSKERVASLTLAQKRSFPPLCPEFVIEVQSHSDSLPRAKRKMREWIDNGAQLGWLIVADTRTVFVFRPNHEPEERTNINTIAGEDPVAGFTLDLTDVWAGL